MNESGFTAAEYIAWGLNGFVCLLLFIKHYWNRKEDRFWAPPLFLAGIYFYYVLLGPWIARTFGDGMDRGVDMRPFYVIAWAGAGVALVSWLAGYTIYPLIRTPISRVQTRRIVSSTELWRLGVAMNLYGLTAFILTQGVSGFSMINPFTEQEEVAGIAYRGVFTNYLSLSMNMLIPGCATVLLSGLMARGRKISIIVWVTIAAGIFITLGFRYRIVLLSGSLTFVYYLYHRTRPNLLLMLSAATIFVVLMGIIGNARTYGRGLDLTRNEDRTWQDSLLSGFGEAGIFATSGAVIAAVPESRPFVGFEPIKQAILMPIPSALFPEKNSAGYATDTLIAVYGEKDYFGAAYMLFAEWYQAFWWPGVVVAFFVFGFAARYTWEWFLARRNNPLALVVYASAVSYLYVILSRGYLPQIVMLFFFSVAPAIALYHWPDKVLRFTPKSFGPRVAKGPLKHGAALDHMGDRSVRS